jgi:hypothetical protein
VTSFQTAIGVFGGLLMIGALLSGIARRSVLSWWLCSCRPGSRWAKVAPACCDSRSDRGSSPT